MTKVKNINGSGFYHGIPAGYTSWLDYWEKTTGKKATKCGACGKTTNLVGAHVKKVYGSDDHYYITPLCSGCNQRTDEFYVDTELAPCPTNR